MNCRRVVSLMSAYVDGELTGVEMLEIRRHISECEECAQEHDAVRLTKQAVSRLRTVAPREDFVHSILARLDEVEVPPYQRVANAAADFVHRKLSPVAAALAASGVALVILSASGVDNVRPESHPIIASSSFVGHARELDLTAGSSIPLTPKPLEVVDATTYDGEPTIHWTSLGQ